MPFQKGNQLGKGNKGRKASKKTKDKLSKSIEKAYKKGLIFGFQKGHKGYKNEGQFKKGNKPWNYVAGKSIPRRISNPKWIEKAKECYKRDNFNCIFNLLRSCSFFQNLPKFFSCFIHKIFENRTI